MTQENQSSPITISTTQSIILEGTDVEVTRFLEYVAEQWLEIVSSSMNISNVSYDIGHHMLTFDTDCFSIDISDHLLNLSSLFPTIFMMYQGFPKNNTTDKFDVEYYIYDGKITIHEDFTSMTDIS
jgi:hypothetical protein